LECENNHRFRINRSTLAQASKLAGKLSFFSTVEHVPSENGSTTPSKVSILGTILYTMKLNQHLAGAAAIMIDTAEMIKFGRFANIPLAPLPIKIPVVTVNIYYNILNKDVLITS
jgi:hypothetical protein